MRPGVRLFEIFTLSLATILLEVSYTRVFSFKLVYFFTYVVIGLALLGLGSGGVLVALFRPERRRGPDRLLAMLCAIAPVCVVLGYLVVATVQVNAFDMIRQSADGSNAFVAEACKLGVVSAALFVPFLCAGLALATILAADPAHIGRLYGADLLGAGLGCAVSVVLIDRVSPPGVVMLAAGAFGLAGVRVARATLPRSTRVLGLVATAIAFALMLAPERLPDVVVDNTKQMNPKDRPPVLFTRWSSVFRVDVMDLPLFAHTGRALIHDGMWGSVLPRIDDDPALAKRLEDDPRALPFAILPAAPTVTIIGSAGGTEIVTALHLGAKHVTGVELNPVTVGLLRGPFKAYTGNMADDPRVRLVNAEGRAYLAGTAEQSDLMWFVAPDSYAAMNAATSGAFVLSESYLYTAEMIEAALAHVGPTGIVCAQFGEIRYEQKPNRTTRYLTTAREAFRRLGITDFPAHVIVATSPGFGFTTSTILLGRTPFAPADVERLRTRADATATRIRFPAPPEDAGRPVPSAITLAPDALQSWYATYPFDVRPVTDDRPFFWHFVSFPGAFRNTLVAGAAATEEGLGERLLVVLLGLVTVFAAMALVLPVLARRALWASLPQKGVAMTYFAGLGLGFMLFELTLIQHLTLFLGYPTYSLSVTLCALLVSAGVGSLVSERFASSGRPIPFLAVALVACVLALRLGLPMAIDAAGGAALATRIAIALAFVVPLGLCLGMFMPLGLAAISAGTEHRAEYVAWAWAVNGFFSVVASVLGTLLSMTWGFQTVLWIALAVYGVALTALHRLRDETPGIAGDVPARARASAA
jgi:spermidine synthase/preprotein translocase subunit SecG